MKPIITAPKGYASIEEEKPVRPGTYRVFTKERVITCSYWDGGQFEYERDNDYVSHWSERKRRI